MGFDPARIDATTLFGASGDASLQTYCSAIGIAFSPALTDQEQGSCDPRPLAADLQLRRGVERRPAEVHPLWRRADYRGNAVASTIQVADPRPVTPASGPTPPPDIVACPASEWVADGGVSYAFSGVALTSVGSSSAGDGGNLWNLAEGTYLFAPGDEDQVVAIPIPIPFRSLFARPHADLQPDRPRFRRRHGEQGSRPGYAPSTPYAARYRARRMPVAHQSVRLGPRRGARSSQIDSTVPASARPSPPIEICDDVGVGADRGADHPPARPLRPRPFQVQAELGIRPSWSRWTSSTITDANLGLSNAAVRIVEIEEDDTSLSASPPRS